MKTCIICQAAFKSTIVIGGIRRNLKNRTKCLNCAPFQSSKSKPISEARRSAALKSKRYYYKQKEMGIDRIKMLRNTRKKTIINLLGGKCQICTYSKTPRNLVFHHLQNKEFNLSTRGFQYKYSKLLHEIKKCILVCHNCHGEIHDGLINQSIVDSLNKQVIETIEHHIKTCDASYKPYS